MSHKTDTTSFTTEKRGELALFLDTRVPYITKILKRKYSKMPSISVEDLAREAIVRIISLKKPKTFTEEHLMAYFYVVTKNLVIEARRKELRQKELYSIIAVPELYLTPENTEEIESGRLTQFKQLIEKLSLEDKQLLFQKLEGQSFVKMASYCSVSPSTLRRRYNRIKKKLHELIEQTEMQNQKGGALDE